MAQGVNKKYLKGRTAGGVYTELLIHYAAWKSHIERKHSNPVDIGSTYKKNKQQYDYNAWWFETAGTLNLAKKVISNGPNFIKSLRDVLKYL